MNKFLRYALKKRRRILVALSLAVLAFDAMACTVPSRGQTWTTDELIDKTEYIAVIEVGSDQTSDSMSSAISFRQIEILKGGPPLALPRLPPHTSRGFENFKDDGFSLHLDPNFWREGVGRPGFWISGSCLPMRSFMHGNRYLVFFGFNPMSHPKAAEIVGNDLDLWLNYVKKRIRSKV